MIMPSSTYLAELEACLNSFSLTERSQALAELAALAKSDAIQTTAEREVANMHCHTFFSFNAYGYSPSALAWMAKKHGVGLLGSVDFDVLDAVDEFLDACMTVGVRGSAALETRVFVPEFSTREINSPGEPGIYYYMGTGFTSRLVPDTAADIQTEMRQRAEQRNRTMVECINAYLDPVRLDYDRDVLPLTPSGNATERHLLAAYTKAVAEHCANPVVFWAEKLKLTPEQVGTQIGTPAVFQNTVRSKLMKRGGVGYAQPGPDSFPSVEDVTAMICACQALPCAAWLDGLTTGEQAMEELLNLLIAKGVVALNVIPDRNWNIADPETKRVKLQKLYDVVELAAKLNLPLNVGTEMNAPGQKLVDDFDALELAPVKDAFLDGAYFIYGHSMLQRAAGLGYQSVWAKAHFPERCERNAFFTQLGKQLIPSQAAFAWLKSMDASASPADILNTH
jgi:hypothetical protein